MVRHVRVYHSCHRYIRKFRTCAPQGPWTKYLGFHLDEKYTYIRRSPIRVPGGVLQRVQSCCFQSAESDCEFARIWDSLFRQGRAADAIRGEALLLRFSTG